jgi:hypothetical protein
LTSAARPRAPKQFRNSVAGTTLTSIILCPIKSRQSLA